MKTEELVTLLAAGDTVVATHATERRYAIAMAGGLIGALLLLLALLSVRADLAEAALLPLFWLKVGFVASLLAGSLFATIRLARPGARTDRLPAVLAAPVLVMWVVAAFVLLSAEPLARTGLLLGQTWQSCPLLIAMLSVPVFVTVMWATRGLAPTQPRLAGFAAGLLSGATAALVYCLHCPETEAPFIGFWYLLGMLIPAVAGAALGRSLLRW